ncbi:unnamed protein product [Brassica oleracea]
MICAHASGKSQVALIDEQVCFISANRAPRYEPQLKPGANDRLQNFFVYHPKHTQTSVSVSSFTPPISELFGILPRRFLFFASPPKEAGKNTIVGYYHYGFSLSFCSVFGKMPKESSVILLIIFVLLIVANWIATYRLLSCPTGETTFSATAELPMLSANVLSASSKGCGDLADEGMVAQITVAKHRKPNLAPFDLTKKKMMNVILDPIEDSTESQAEQTYSLLGMCRETLVVSFQWCTYITLSLLIFTAAFDGLQSSFAEQKSVSLLSVLVF